MTPEERHEQTMRKMVQQETWLRGLAEKGGKGTVDNVDARALMQVALSLQYLREFRDITEAVAAERAACAEVARQYPVKYHGNLIVSPSAAAEQAAEEIAAAIEARADPEKEE